MRESRGAAVAVAAALALLSGGCGQGSPSADEIPTPDGSWLLSREADSREPKSPDIPPNSGTPSSESATPKGSGHVEETALPPGSVPADLVGTWDGGSGPGERKIRFSDDGTVELHYNSGLTLRGTAVVRGRSMTIYLPGAVEVVKQWSTEHMEPLYGYTFQLLMLDGFSYVREIGST
ncbi:hypothetical protein GCM10010244_85740 [Streptomyces coeruleorubidus]|nr:hypothetical protein GCM10010244_85740 [Streptomyces bellus]